ncbi:hypothetical protein R3P38DRAFT_3185673 [Favolaschia claudopus]|uniref:F-box domain-containing protein n=1 Tax=Favolaschia claudopus TaxID=2862362 RepID=A0AAW0C3R2_9AGAR
MASLSQGTESSSELPRNINTFSPEVLTRIFLFLSYKSLLSVLAVCVQWNRLVFEDPALSVQIFKRPSKKYIAPGKSGEMASYDSYEGASDIHSGRYDRYERDGGYLSFRKSKSEHGEQRLLAAWAQSRENVETANALLTSPKLSIPDRVRLHPALSQVSYTIGQDLKDVGFFIDHDLVELTKFIELANDFLSIPAVTMAHIDVSYIAHISAFEFTVKNEEGVTVLDFFAEFVKEATRKVKRGKKTTTMADRLGDHW